MFGWMKWIAPAVGLAMWVGFNPAVKAQDAAAPTGKATVTVTVVDSDGKPVEGAKVGLLPGKAGKHHKGQQNDVNNGPAAGAPGAGGPGDTPGNRPKPIASGVTDKDGKAVLTNVPDGTYNVTAGLKGSGHGTEKVTVADGKDASVTITLKKHAKGAGPGDPAAPATPAAPTVAK